MALEDVIAKISKSAEDKKAAYMKEAETEKEKILSEWKTKAKEFFDSEYKKCEIDAANEKRSIILAKRLELRKELLSAKQKVIEDAFLTAFNKIKSLPQKDYEAFLERMLKESAEDGEELIGRKEDKAVLEAIIKKSSKKITLSKETRDISGGFILKKGKIETNVSFDTLFESKRHDLEQEVGKLLNVF